MYQKVLIIKTPYKDYNINPDSNSTKTNTVCTDSQAKSADWLIMQEPAACLA